MASQETLVLSNLHPSCQGIPPEAAYRVTGDSARRSGEIRQICGHLGRVCEAAYVQCVSGRMILDPKKRSTLTSASEAIKKLTAPINLSTHTHPQLERLYGPIAARSDGFEDGRITFLNPELRLLLREVDDLFGLDLLSTFRSQPEEDLGPAGSRYLVETALILAKLALHPPTPAGLPVGNIYISEDGTLLTQIDLLRTDISAADTLADIYRHQRQSPRFSASTPLHWIVGQHPYSVLEIKTPFRADTVSGPHSLQRPREMQLRQFMNRVGRLIIWAAARERPFPVPVAVEMVYLRGSLPSATYYQQLDAAFLNSWIDVLGCRYRQISDRKHDLANHHPTQSAEQIAGIEKDLAQINQLVDALYPAWLEREQAEASEQAERQRKAREFSETIKLHAPRQTPIFPGDKQQAVRKVRRVWLRSRPKPLPSD